MIIIGEIGINANGSIDLAKKLINGAVAAGCDLVKFQKRDVDLVYSQEFLDSPRVSPWGSTQRAQKMGLEFGQEEFEEIDDYCSEKEIGWFASAWDLNSLDFLDWFAHNGLAMRYNKIASPMITKLGFVYECSIIASSFEKTFLSTGMSTYQEIQAAIDMFLMNVPRGLWKEKFELMHCVSSYPTSPENANLQMIKHLRNMFLLDVGFSDHSLGCNLAISATALGATSIEKHITLDRELYGSDQKLSTEIGRELSDFVKAIREAERATKEINPIRSIYACEKAARESLVGG